MCVNTPDHKPPSPHRRSPVNKTPLGNSKLPHWKTVLNNYYTKVLAFFFVYTGIVMYATSEINTTPTEKEVPRFILSISYAIFPTLLGVFSVQTRRTSLAFLYMQVCTVLMNFVTSIAWYRNPRELRNLPDVGHDLFPMPKEHYSIFGYGQFETSAVSDNIILTLAVATVFKFGQRANFGDIFRRFIFVYGTLELMRSCTVLLTSLPDASPACRKLTPMGDIWNGAHTWSAINTPSIWYEIMIHTLKILIPIHPVTCGDMVFSGHTNTACCLALVWHTYYKWVPGPVNLVKVLVWVAAMTAALMLIVCRVHYTLDVALAIFFSMTIWGSYHRFAVDVALGRRFISVWCVDQLICYPLVEYLELPLIGEANKNGGVKVKREEMNLFDLQLVGILLDEEEQGVAGVKERRRLQRKYLRESSM